MAVSEGDLNGRTELTPGDLNNLLGWGWFCLGRLRGNSFPSGDRSGNCFSGGRPRLVARLRHRLPAATVTPTGLHEKRGVEQVVAVSRGSHDSPVHRVELASSG